MAGKIREALITPRRFLQSGYSLKRLSRDTGYTTRELSAYFKDTVRMSFATYLSQLRIYHCLGQVLAGHPEYSMRELARHCGFYDHQSFKNAFRKFIGIYPSGFFSLRRSASDN